MSAARALIVGAAAGLALAASRPASAVAQEAADPIGALLQAGPQPVDEEAAESGAPVATDPEPAVAPTPGAAAPPPPPRLTAPVYVDQTGKNPDAPPSVRDLAYDSRIRASMAATDAFQGPLDGAWTLSAGGAPLYAFQLADRGRGVVEGAWRDLRRPGALDGSGFVEEIATQGAELVLRVAPGRTVTLRAGGNGRWSGDLQEGQSRQAVVLARPLTRR